MSMPFSLDFDIQFNKSLADVPHGGIFLHPNDGKVYRRISDGHWRGLYERIGDDSVHAVNFHDKTIAVHRIYTPLEGISLVRLAGWYEGRYFEQRHPQEKIHA